MVEGNNDFGIEGFSHPQDVRRGHLVGNAARVFPIGTQGYINLVFIAMLGVAIGIMRVTR